MSETFLKNYTNYPNDRKEVKRITDDCDIFTKELTEKIEDMCDTFFGLNIVEENDEW